MMFNVLITETRLRAIQIEAQTEDEAIAQAEKKYLEGEIVLDSDGDFDHASYMVVS